MRQRGGQLLSNPVLVGAVTILVVTIAVFLSYNANSGLPFVPTMQLKVVVPDAAKLVAGNEVREGGFRVGTVSQMRPTRLPNGETGAELTLKLDQKAAPLPRDTTVAIRPRSALGLKYIDLSRGVSPVNLADGDSIRVGANAIGPELEDLFKTFDEPTRENIQRNLAEGAAALTGRGDDLNRTIGSLPQMLTELEAVTRNLADPDTNLERFIRELADAARITAPVADQLVEGFRNGAITFEAISRDPQALRETIERSPGTLAAGAADLRGQRPFLRRLAGISDDLRVTAATVRDIAPPTSAALAAGTPVLGRLTPFNRRLGGSLAELRTFARAPLTNVAIGNTTELVNTLNPMVRYLGPHITVCNYWNYFWTYTADHFSHRDETGSVERIQVKNVPPFQHNTPGSFGAPQPANGGGGHDPIGGDPVYLHAQPYGRAVDESGNADCESGQRGYPRRLAAGADPSLQIVIDPRTPGNQGPTFTGRPRVPRGQTFTAEPETGYSPGAGRVLPSP